MSDFVAGLIIMLIVLMALGAIMQQIQKNKQPEKTQLELMKEEFWGKVWSKWYILTKTEKAFYDQLVVYLMNTGYSVFAQVRLPDIVEIRNAGERFNYFFNKIKAKHVDFVVTDRTGRIMMAIELDDATHDAEEAKYNDTMKDAIFEICQIRLVRFRVAHSYDFNKLGLVMMPVIQQMAVDATNENVPSENVLERGQEEEADIDHEGHSRWMKKGQ